ncbi:MAG: hypothetical protein ACXWMX_02785, partial [Candidatus Limnocylindrales bacterium]
AGATGIAISLVCIDEVDLLRGVQRLLRKAIPYRVVEEFIPDRTIEPRPLGRGGETHHLRRKPVHRAGAGSHS